MPTLSNSVVAQTTRSRIEYSINASSSRRVYDGLKGKITQENPLIPNHPPVGAEVTVAEIIELDLTGVGMVLRSFDVVEMLKADIIADGAQDEGDVLNELQAWKPWMDRDGPKFARDLWRAGQRVMDRIASGNAEELKGKKKVRKWRMQYQRNP